MSRCISWAQTITQSKKGQRTELIFKMILAEWKRGEYTISIDPNRIDLTVVHDFLRDSH